MIVYAEDNGIVRAMRNIPGVDTACVTRLNLLQIAPGGNFGRLLIWTEAAFKKLNEMYGTFKSGAPLKNGYHLPRAAMENADIARIINSSEVQSVLRPQKEAPKKRLAKKNPLKNKMVMDKLNPGMLKKKAIRKRTLESGTKENDRAQKKKSARKEASKAYNKKHKKGDNTFYKSLMNAFEAKTKKAEEGENEVGENED